MATTPEGAVKKAIKKLLEEVGAYYVMPVSNGMGVHGVPDFLVCVGGRFVGIEAKAGDNKPTAMQQSHLEKIRRSGGQAMVINENNINTLRELLLWAK